MLGTALDLFFPPQCLNCEGLVPSHGTLCLTCWQQVRFIDQPFCHCCGLPFDYEMGAEAMCGDCLRELPPYARARSVFVYDDKSRALVIKFKYQDQTQLAPTYGTWLAKSARELISSSDVIVPVPLYYWRFVGRRYNQSALLAGALAKHSGLPLATDAIRRIRPTRPQTGLSRAQREDNVRGAFAAGKQSVKGKSVLLIDDVMTTGITLAQCAKALLDAGALRVQALTLARTASNS